MQFDFEFLPATFIARPNRFLVVAELQANGEIVRAHCPDPGRMRELLLPGTVVYLSTAKNPNRKTRYDLRFVVHPHAGVLVSTDSTLPNRLFAEAMQQGAAPPLSDYTVQQAEVTLPDEVTGGTGVRSRIDFLLSDGNGTPLWVEVKSATLVENRVALFPDAKTDRGRRHVLELVKLKQKTGHRVAVAFVVQREDADMVKPQREIDPDFADAMYYAVQEGLETYAFVCDVSLETISIARAIDVVVSATD